jgi:hypothetical protein
MSLSNFLKTFFTYGEHQAIVELLQHFHVAHFHQPLKTNMKM